MEKRKQGRPSLPRNIEEYVITAAMKNPSMKRLALVDKVEKELRELKLTPPAKDTMLKLFQKAPKPGEEDKPWSLAKSVEYTLNPEATEDLLGIWSYCLAADREFTIRQAKWVCYLRSTVYVPEQQSQLKSSYLYSFSSLYANRERICKSLNVDLDTYDLDIFVGLSKMEALPALKTGVLDKNRLRIRESLPETIIGKVRTQYEDVTDTILDNLGFKNEIPSFYHPLHDRPKLDEEFFPIELLDHVNAYWLRYISKGPKWQTLSHKEQRNIILELQQSIEEEAKKEDHRKVNQYLVMGRWEPTELLKAVGYEVNDPITKNPGRTIEGLMFKALGFNDNYHFWNSIDEEAEELYREVGR